MLFIFQESLTVEQNYTEKTWDFSDAKINFKKVIGGSKKLIK